MNNQYTLVFIPFEHVIVCLDVRNTQWLKIIGQDVNEGHLFLLNMHEFLQVSLKTAFSIKTEYQEFKTKTLVNIQNNPPVCQSEVACRFYALYQRAVHSPLCYYFYQHHFNIKNCKVKLLCSKHPTLHSSALHQFPWNSTMKLSQNKTSVAKVKAVLLSWKDEHTERATI